PKQMNIIRDELQDIASSGGAYKSKQGQIVGQNNRFATAAKQAAATVRKDINTKFPEMAKAYNQLAELHSIQGKLGKGLLKEGSNPTSLLNASKEGAYKSRWLEKLSDVSGSNTL